jgi:MoaA/NifB/PqqE/SkfB family radical SAM enzyme
MKNVKSIWYAGLIKANPWLFLPNEKVLNYIKYKLLKKTIKLDRIKYTPVVVFFNISRRCNLKCSFCCIGAELNKNEWRKQETSLRDIKEIFEQDTFRKALYINLVGGEPTINKDIVPIVKFLKSRRHLVSIITNGYKLAELWPNLKAAGLDGINVSLYDENETLLYNTLPQVTPHFLVKLCKVLNREIFSNPEPISQTMELAVKSGCKAVFFQNTIPTFNAKANLDEHVIYDDRHEEFERIKVIFEEKYPNICIYWPQLVKLNGHRKTTCRMPWYSAFADHHGNIGYCCHSNMRLGDSILGRPEQEIANNDFWTNIREGLIDETKPLAEPCQGCYIAHDTYNGTV